MEEHGVSKVVSVKFSPREELKRKETEQEREDQEDRIDGAAILATKSGGDRRPHEEDLGNELLDRKQDTVAAIEENVEVVAEHAIRLGEQAPQIVAGETAETATDTDTSDD